jgi:hypothetical protein
MSDVMTHPQWMHLTHGGYTTTRSSELKVVDAALAKYQKTKSQADKDAVLAALIRWMQSKGAGWKTSVRNKNQAVEILYGQLTGIGGVRLTGIEMVGLSHLRDESRAIVQDLFFGKSLVWRNNFASKLANNKWGFRANVASGLRNLNTVTGGALAGGAAAVAGGARHVGNQVRGPGSGDSLAADLIRSVVPPDIMADVMLELPKVIPDFMRELAASLTPLVGLITTAGGAVWSAKNALRGQWRLEWARYHITGSLTSAEPAAALIALTKTLERERNAEIFSASVGIAEFGGKLAGLLVDAGTATNAAVSLAANIVKLLNIVRVIVRDVVERNGANKQMKTRVEASIFDVCPVVGAYLICCAPTSVMVNTIFEGRFGQHGWQSEVENAVKRHLEPLKEQAQRVVHEHRFWIPQLQSYPGILKRNEDKLKEMLARKGKSNMEGFGPDNLPAALKTGA